MRELYKRAAPHIDRVRLDGGVPTDNVQELLLLKRSNEELKNVLRLSYCPELHGNKIRTSGINNFITKGYDEATSNDLTQTASATQPFLDKIAPTEKLSAKNTTGTYTYLTHAPVVFSMTDKWTLEATINLYGASNMENERCCIAGGDTSGISLVYNGINRPRFFNGNHYFFTEVILSRFTGKTAILTFVASGDGALALYANGKMLQLLNITTNFNLSALLSGISLSTSNSFRGNVFSYHVFSDALNAQQVAERASVLRSIFPEIPFTRIGEQIWSVRNYEAVCTPQGTLIPEVQLASNVEKITNVADREFTSDTGFWQKQTGGVTISGGTANIGAISAYTQGIHRVDILTSGKWYKITVSIVNYISGSPFINDTANIGFALPKANGTYTAYFKPVLPNIRLTSETNSNSFSYDNISIQEVGWADAQNLYDYTYAATAGTVEQKTYAACKAAAMWCHYNNDATLGATYGKLYNWFAVKLLQMDIDYFNAANPATPWGWRVPTQADFNTLATTLGGITIAGGKLKLNDLRYWLSPNAGADNASGFSAIGSSARLTDGSYFESKSVHDCWTVTENDTFNAQRIEMLASDSLLYITSRDKIRGYSLRLIKTA